MPKIAKPETGMKPSIRFVPSKRQYESGIDFVDAAGFRHKITLDGFTAPTLEDERTLLRVMERDRYCGITTWENREMPPEQRRAETETRSLRVENEAMKVEMEALREQVARLEAAQKTAG